MIYSWAGNVTWISAWFEQNVGFLIVGQKLGQFGYFYIFLYCPPMPINILEYLISMANKTENTVHSYAARKRANLKVTIRNEKTKLWRLFHKYFETTHWGK